MTLGEKQRAFARLTTVRLYPKLFELGFEFTYGDAFRDPRVHGAIGVKMGYGHRSSAHKNKLAIDLNLYRNGAFLTRTEDHRQLGEFWESLGTAELVTCWGGRFDDGNHYSVLHDGMK